MGACQRLPNGNTLVLDSLAGEAYEITPEGVPVWRFRSPIETEDGLRASSYRMVYYSPEFIEPLLDRDDS